MMVAGAADRLKTEHERLVRLVAGPDGLDSNAWSDVPRKTELIAVQQISRADGNARKK